MKSFGRLMLGVMLVPVFCGLLFAIVYLVLVGLTIPQLPCLGTARSGGLDDGHPAEQ